MKILMLVNWKIKYCDTIPTDKQPPDYYVKGLPYWFFRYFDDVPDVDVIDISSVKWLENFEKNKLHFYIWQTLKAIPKLRKYDLIVSHGMQSGIVLSLWRKIFKTKAKHVVFDIGSFNSAAEEGFALKLMQSASKSIDWIIYHTSSQLDYYKKFFPHVVNKSTFLRFGTDLDFFDPSDLKESQDRGQYILCVGYAERDRDTLVKAYSKIQTSTKLRFVGYIDEKFKGIQKIEQIDKLPIRDLINQIYNAKFCVLPLRPLNFSYGQMTLMQQMALGKCVIASKVPSLVDYIEDNKTGLLYEPFNVEDLTTKLEFALNNPVLIDKIAKNGQEYLKNYCNEKIMAKETERLFIKILNWENSNA